MAFQLKNNRDNSVLHNDTLSEKDFKTSQLKDEWLHLNHPDGEMKMKQWVFDGVRIGYSDWNFNKPVILQWEGNLDVVTMYYSLKGSVSIGDAVGNSMLLRNNQQNMYYGTEASGMMKVDELRIKSFMVQFNKEAFLRIASGGTDALKYFADQVAAKKTAAFSTGDLPVDIAAQNSIDAIINCRFSESLKRIFFLSKAMELMVLQAEAHSRSLSKKTTHIKSEYDRDRIIFVRDYMMQHIDMPPTIPELSKIAGINEFKLKKGYKEIFGNTIFRHLAETRLEQAKYAIQEGKRSISDIAFELGYSSVQHFCAAFRKKFGLPPKQVQLMWRKSYR